MSKKAFILLGIGIVIVSAGLVIGGLLLFKQPSSQTPPDDTTTTTPQPGDVVDVSKVPDYKSCAVVSQKLLSTIDANFITSVSDGELSGEIAPNHEDAQVCSYTVKTPKSDTATFTVLSYLYAPNDGDTNPNELDQDWGNVSKGIYGYNLSLPAYFKPVTTDTDFTMTLHLIDGPRTIRFIFTQPGTERFETVPTLKLLLAIANKADFKVAANSLQSDDN